MFEATGLTKRAASSKQPISRALPSGAKASLKKAVQATPGAVNPGTVRARSRKARVDAMCKRMSRLLRTIAYRTAQRLPAHVEVEELIGAGAVGLVTAVRQHLDKPAPELMRLAARRIRGAIMDHLRASDHLTRRQRAAVVAVEKAKAALEQSGGTSDMEAVARRLGLSTRRATQIQDRFMAVQLGALDDADNIAAHDNTSESFVAREDQSRLAAALASLPERLHVLVELCYFEDLSYRDVSLKLGISRSRVCQLHGEALQCLRCSMGG